MLIRLTSRDFVEGKLNRTGVIVVMFYADWCPFCMFFKPQFEEYAKKGNTDFGEYNISHYDDPLWGQFQIKVVPSILVFKDGEIVKRKDGRLFRGLNKSDIDEATSSL
jgi:thiol-disulfide isomerase/thioredoxin